MSKEVEDPNLWSDQNKAKSILKEKTYLETNIERIISIDENLQAYLEMIELAEIEKDEEIYKETLEQLKELENQYQVKINSSKIDLNIMFTGTFTNKNLNLALQTICSPLSIYFKIDDNTVALSKK